MPIYTIYNRGGSAIYTATADTKKAFFKAIPAGTNLTNANLDGEDLSEVNWAGITLTNASLKGANCRAMKAPDCTLTNADFTRANLDKANFQKATTTNVTTTDSTQKGCKGL